MIVTEFVLGQQQLSSKASVRAQSITLFRPQAIKGNLVQCTNLLNVPLVVDGLCLELSLLNHLKPKSCILP